MKIILFLLLLVQPVIAERKIWARITYYSPYESGGWSISADKRKNREGWGVAAHPDFKFYTKISIPMLEGKLDKDAEFEVIDRGSAVTSKKAAKGKGYVFDVFVNKRGAALRKFVEKMPEWGWVIIK